MDEAKKKETSHWDEEDLEKHFFGEDRKLSKQMRKMASAKDRSKYKKTDQDKLQKKIQKETQQEGLLRGRVLSNASQGNIVECEGEIYECILRGVLKKEKSQMKNLITVGDFVLFQQTSEKEGVIYYVEPRKSVLSRADNLSRRKEQLIAANIDQVLITTSVVSPPIKPFLVDRYIIAAKKGGMTPIIIVNKIDLLQKESTDPILLEVELEIFREFLEAYEIANIKVVPVSVATGEGLDVLKEIMKGKASVFSGQSGVGKSSLINAITGLNLRIGSIVDKTQKGAHTTSATHLLPLEFGGWCIDTPGIKSFGIWDLKKDEISQYFSEISQIGHTCKFPNCDHIHEEECAVRVAVEEGKISPLRYESYLNLLQSVAEEHLRR